MSKIGITFSDLSTIFGLYLLCLSRFSDKHFPSFHAGGAVELRGLGVLPGWKGPADLLEPVGIGCSGTELCERPDGHKGECPIGPSTEVCIVAIFHVLASGHEEGPEPAGRARPPDGTTKTQLRYFALGEIHGGRKEADR